MAKKRVKRCVICHKPVNQCTGALYGTHQTRSNPARWAHGVMSYRQPPGSVIPMSNNPPGGQYYLNRGRRRRLPGPFEITTYRRRRGRGLHNPYRRNPGKGGTNWLLIGGLAAGAFFLLPKLMGTAGANPLSALFGGGAAAGVPAGYTPIGNGLYRAPNGAVVARNPQTGQMVAAPAGSQPTSAEDLLTRAGISMIPSVANNLASWISSMFSTQQTATGALAPLDQATSDVLFGSPDLPPLTPLPYDSPLWGSGGSMSQEEYEWTVGSGAGLPPLTEIPTYPVFDYGNYDWGSYQYDPYELPGLPPLDYDVMIGVGSGEVTISNPDEWWGYMGLGASVRGGRRRPYMGLRATPPVY